MKVLFVVNEAFPIYKIGGLGDVGGALPKNLAKIGVDVSICMPKHPQVHLDESWHEESQFSIHYDLEELKVRVLRGKLPDSNVDVYCLEEAKYLSQPTDASDNHADKYAVFSLAVCIWQAQYAKQKSNLIHLNDWHTALVPIINKHLLNIQDVKYLITIHNLMYQGSTNTPIIQKLGIDPSVCQIISWDNQDNVINILLEGLLHADVITTVSPQYAKEILTQEYGEKINEIISLRKTDISGILNGLDLESFNPGSDSMIFQNYTIDDFKIGKAVNKKQLQAELNLVPNENQTIIGFVGRIDPRQKGIDLIIDAINQNKLLEPNQQFIFLGTGDSDLESKLHQAAQDKDNVKIITRFDEPLSRKMYAASDFLLIPSKFEPCGLIQMIANQYGCLPIAHATGGLIDTITHGENGFLFSQYNTQSMLDCLREAIGRCSQIDEKNRLIQNAMTHDFSWEKSAVKYQKMYQNLASPQNNQI